MEISGIGQTINNLIVNVGDKTEAFISDAYTKNVGTFQSIVDGIGNTIAIYLGVWIIIEGYKILWGGSKQNVQSFLWDGSMKIIFIALATNAGSWIILTHDAFLGIKDYAMNSIAGGSSIYKLLGQWGSYVGNFVNSVLKDTSFVPPYIFLDVFVMIFGVVGFAIGIFPVLRALLINTISFLVLSCIAPIAFYFLIFKTTKNSFSQWLQMIISNILSLMFICFFIGLFLNFLFPNMNISNLDYDDRFHIMTKLIFTGIMISAFNAIATSTAQSLTQVSMEGLANSAIGRSIGITAGVSAIGVGMGMQTIRGARALANANLTKNATGFIGGLAKNGVKDLGKAALNTQKGQVIQQMASKIGNSNIGQGVKSAYNTAKKGARNIKATALKANRYSQGKGWLK